MRTLSPRSFSRLITVWIALSAGGIALGVVLWGQLNASLETMVEKAKVREQVARVFALLQDAESGQRGYLLTGDESYLKAFNETDGGIPDQLDSLARMTFNDDILRRDVPELRALTALRMAEMRRAIEARRRNGLSAALKAAPSREEKGGGDKFRALAAEMNGRTGEPAFVLQEATRRAIRRALLTTVGSSLLGLGAGLLAFHLSRVTLKQEQNARLMAEQALTSDRAVREKSAFLANMSHEIRTPMNAILGFSDLLSVEVTEDSKARTYARAIRDSASSLLQLINDILDLSKIEAGMIELRPEPMAMREVADFLRTIFAQQAAIKSLKAEVVLGTGLPPALMLDRSRLRQVLVNLMSNALKYTERGGVETRLGWIADPADRSRGTLLVEVSDTGIGIPAERQKDIFEPFVPIAPGPAAESQGTGLGLSIVKRLVQRMGGTLNLESAAGAGTTFRLQFPGVSLSSRLPESALAGADDRADFDELVPSKLLVVDDNSVNRELLAGYFEHTHHTVGFASNGVEAVESVRRDLPDLVLMDVRMPKMDGRSALREIHKLSGAEILPVIAVTASSMSGEEAMLRGIFAGYVRKPFTRRALFDEMAAFLPSRPRAGAPQAAEEAAEPAPARTGWGELVAQLEELLAGAWVAVKDGGAINETKAFAERLTELGRAAGCRRLAHYGEALEREAQTYAVAGIVARLNGFPMLVRSIAEKCTALTS
jgi:signal transduction histidine kinase/ActR/RegA family two-component response regulator